MPAASAYSVEQILDAAKIYFKKTGRRVIIEYILMKCFNDEDLDIKALIDSVRDLNCHINVIPLNSASGGYTPASNNEAHEFASKLKKAGRDATVRRSLGGDIEGACGQLRLKQGNK